MFAFAVRSKSLTNPSSNGLTFGQVVDAEVEGPPTTAKGVKPVLQPPVIMRAGDTPLVVGLRYPSDATVFPGVLSNSISALATTCTGVPTGCVKPPEVSKRKIV